MTTARSVTASLRALLKVAIGTDEQRICVVETMREGGVSTCVLFVVIVRDEENSLVGVFAMLPACRGCRRRKLWFDLCAESPQVLTAARSVIDSSMASLKVEMQTAKQGIWAEETVRDGGVNTCVSFVVIVRDKENSLVGVLQCLQPVVVVVGGNFGLIGVQKVFKY